MTLLVLDIRLPDDFRPADGGQLLHALYGLWPKLLPYVLSFIVLSLRWLVGVQVRSRAESFGAGYIRWWMLYLLLITCVPFTTIVVGRYAAFAPAVWLYAGNTAMIAIASWRMLAFVPELENEHQVRGRQASALLLLLSALLCLGWSFVSPPQSLWALLLNIGAPLLVRQTGPRLRDRPMER